MLALLNIKAEQPISDWLAVGSPLPAAAAAALSMGLISALAGSADTILLSAAGIIEKDLFGGAVHVPCVSGLQPSAFWPHWPPIPRETSSGGSSRATRSSSRRCRAAPRPRRRQGPTRGSQALDYWGRRGRPGRAYRQPYRHHPLDLRRHRCCRPFCDLCRTARRPNPPNSRRVTASAAFIN